MDFSTELLTAELSFSADGDIENKLAGIDKQIEKYTNHADRFDYALSVGSGVLCGVIDALFVQEISVVQADIDASHKTVNKFILDYAEDRDIDIDNLSFDRVIAKLEKMFPVAQDSQEVWGNISGIVPRNHHLADLAHHPTPVGLLSAIVVQFLRIGTFVNKDGKWTFKFVKTNPKDLARIWAPAVITGLLNWLVSVSESVYEANNDEDIPEAIHKLAHALASAPLALEIMKCADNWFGHLVSDMAGSKQTAGDGMGIPGVFMSLLYEVGSLPIIKETGILEYLDDLYEGKGADRKKWNLRRELPYAKAVGKQAVPVLINEAIVRTFYFVRRLIMELDGREEGERIPWDKIIPFDNRTLDRMLMISTVTFSVADTADAAVRAAVVSGGNMAVFAGRFVKRFNYVGAGRATLAIVKEYSNESKEASLWHDKRLLVEQKSAQIVAQIDAYKEQLEALVSQYIAEDIELYLTSFNEMDEALETGDSDMFIQANVTIQSRFGREAQFETQEEFDELMDSDEAFVL